MDFEDVIMPNRELGEGQWDRRLKVRMTDLSVAEMYDEAKHEWIVTGECWYIPFGDNAQMVLPDEHRGNAHSHECLCGHPIVWHFEIENTENELKEIVGSEHIESYMILRHFEQLGIDPATVTEQMIEEWITEKIKSLKAEWWWKLHGDQFTEWFEAIRELDMRVNVRESGRSWNNQFRRHEPTLVLRKRADGKFGEPGYKMASVTWRWNNPNNTRRQIDSRGYPNERLWNDIQILYVTRQMHEERIAAEEREQNARLDELAEQDRQAAEANAERQERFRIRREEQRIIREQNEIRAAEMDGVQEERRIEIAIANRMTTESAEEVFLEMCEYYDIPPFSATMGGTNNWNHRFLTDMFHRLSQGKSLSEKQLATLRNIVVDEPLPATDRQKWYIQKLAGKDYEIPRDLDRTEASNLISQLKGEEE